MRKEIRGENLNQSSPFWAIAVLVSLVLAVLGGQAQSNNKPKTKSRLSSYELLTGQSREEMSNQWDVAYSQSKGLLFPAEPEPILKEAVQYMAPGGLVMDLAMAEGRHSIYLAKKGFRVEGIDISEQALLRARRLARQEGVKIRTVLADIYKYNFPEGAYDVVLDIDFLDRKLFAVYKKTLKRGGIIVVQAHTHDNVKYKRSQRKDETLAPGELKDIFKDFEILQYRETDTGQNIFAQLIAKKR